MTPTPTPTPTIVHSVHFAVSARQLYAIYLDPRRHAAFTGEQVKITPKPGSPFEAFAGMLRGSMVAAVPGKLIVQRRRSGHFKKTDPDSILVLQFVQDGRRGRIDMTHINVTEQDHAGVTKGWPKWCFVFPTGAALSIQVAKRRAGDCLSRGCDRLRKAQVRKELIWMPWKRNEKSKNFAAALEVWSLARSRCASARPA